MGVVCEGQGGGRRRTTLPSLIRNVAIITAQIVVRTARLLPRLVLGAQDNPRI